MTAAEKIMMTFTEEDWNKIKEYLMDGIKENLNEGLSDYYMMHQAIYDIIAEEVKEQVCKVLDTTIKQALEENKELLNEVVKKEMLEQLKGM